MIGYRSACRFSWLVHHVVKRLEINVNKGFRYALGFAVLCGLFVHARLSSVLNI
jgi:hypothetical protein